MSPAEQIVADMRALQDLAQKVFTAPLPQDHGLTMQTIAAHLVKQVRGKVVELAKASGFVVSIRLQRGPLHVSVQALPTGRFMWADYWKEDGQRACITLKRTSRNGCDPVVVKMGSFSASATGGFGSAVERCIEKVLGSKPYACKLEDLLILGQTGAGNEVNPLVVSYEMPHDVWQRLTGEVTT